jgi:hypothetical protein
LDARLPNPLLGPLLGREVESALDNKVSHVNEIGVRRGLLKIEKGPIQDEVTIDVGVLKPHGAIELHIGETGIPVDPHVVKTSTLVEYGLVTVEHAPRSGVSEDRFRVKSSTGKINHMVSS